MRAALRFLFCAIPGLLLLLGGMVLLGFAIDPDSVRRWLFALGGVAALAAGVPLILYGTGRWGKWGYILPFISLPVVLFAHSETPWACAVIGVPFVVGAAVHEYYRRTSH